MTRKIVTTADGSHSIFIEALDENYHSVHGAIQESQHVFIDAGFKEVLLRLHNSNRPLTAPLRIFEMGLGTGLNVFMTYLEQLKLSAEQQRPIHYMALEAYPVSFDMASQLNYTAQLAAPANSQAIFEQIHTSAWNESVALSPQFHFTKIQAKLEAEDFILPANAFDLVYYDAFAPSAQAHLWTEAIFEKLYKALTKGGLLTTYCAKGSVKRNLKKVGFTLEALPGPPGKREMTRANCFKILNQ